MRTLSLPALLAVLIGAASGCADEGVSGLEEEPVGKASAAIQGGSVNDGYTFAVGVCFGTGPGDCVRTCSGTLVAPNLVLTSRHCVYVSPERNIDCKKDRFGPPRGGPEDFWITTNVSTNEVDKGWHAVSRLLGTPGDKFCGRDIALLVLRDSLSANEAVPASPGPDLATVINTLGPSFVAVGYGATTPEGTDYGTRRSILNNVRCVPGLANHDCGSLTDVYGATDNEFVADRGLCFGDSGASAFVRSDLEAGRPSTLGVVSRALEIGTSCEHAVYTRTDRWFGFLSYGARVAAEAGGYAVPAWSGLENDTAYPRSELGARCFEPAGCTSGLCASVDGDNNFFCASSCGATTSCPSGFRCTSLEGGGRCIAEERLPPIEESGCSSGPTREHDGALWAVLALVGVLVERRMRLPRGRS